MCTVRKLTTSTFFAINSALRRQNVSDTRYSSRRLIAENHCHAQRRNARETAGNFDASNLPDQLREHAMSAQLLFGESVRQPLRICVLRVRRLRRLVRVPRCIRRLLRNRPSCRRANTRGRRLASAYRWQRVVVFGYLLLIRSRARAHYLREICTIPHVAYAQRA